MGPHQLLQTADQRRHEQTGHSAVEAVRHTAVVALAEFVAQVRVSDRVTQPSQIFTVVAQHVTIVQRNDGALLASQHVAERGPAPSSFALQADVNFV